jgi:acylphosphatase
MSSTADTAEGAGEVRLTAWVRGRVQGVGFRWWTRATVLEIGGLSGYVSNLADGRVQVVAEGPRDRCDQLLDSLHKDSTPGRVDGVTEIWDEPRGGYDGFEIR